MCIKFDKFCGCAVAITTVTWFEVHICFKPGFKIVVGSLSSKIFRKEFTHSLLISSGGGFFVRRVWERMSSMFC